MDNDIKIKTIEELKNSSGKKIDELILTPYVESPKKIIELYEEFLKTADPSLFIPYTYNDDFYLVENNDRYIPFIGFFYDLSEKGSTHREYGEIIDGFAQGAWVTAYSDNQLSKLEYYVKGKHVGWVYQWYENGQKKQKSFFITIYWLNQKNMMKKDA